MNKDEIISKLQSGEVSLSFTKRDNTKRDMRCTLASSRIPVEQKPKTQSDVSLKEEVIHVFDLDKSAWRSVRWDSIISHS